MARERRNRGGFRPCGCSSQAWGPSGRAGEGEVLWEGKVRARRRSHAAAMGIDGGVRDKDEGM
jgi:hypothetical protein